MRLSMEARSQGMPERTGMPTVKRVPFRESSCGQGVSIVCSLAK